MPKLELDTIVVTELTCLLLQERKNLWNRRHVCVCVCVQSVQWLCASMDKWLDSLSVNVTTRVRIPLNVLFFLILFFSPLFLFFLPLLAWADICAAELVTWGVGPDVIGRKKMG